MNIDHNRDIRMTMNETIAYQKERKKLWNEHQVKRIKEYETDMDKLCFMRLKQQALREKKLNSYS